MNGDRWTIPLPSYTRPPLSLNQRLHYQAKARISRQLAADVRNMLTAAQAPRGLTRIGLYLHWLPMQERARDSDNTFATVKVIQDACVDWGVIAGDTHRQVSQSTQIHDAGPAQLFVLANGVTVPARVWFVIKDLSGVVSGDRPTNPPSAA